MNDNMLEGSSPATGSHNSIELANTVAVSEKHGTQSDERDMDRMGKLQELRVCSNITLKQNHGAHNDPAAIRIPDHFRLCCPPWQYMGICDAVGDLRSMLKLTTNISIPTVVSESHSTTEVLPAVYGCSLSSVSACSMSCFH